MVLQMRYPYTSIAPRRRRFITANWTGAGAGLVGGGPYPEDPTTRTAALGRFTVNPRWQRYLNLKAENDNRKVNLPVFSQRYVQQAPISTGWLINKLRRWIRRAVSRVTRRRLYGNPLGEVPFLPFAVRNYGVKYPD